jgi:hypothetical protein
MLRSSGFGFGFPEQAWFNESAVGVSPFAGTVAAPTTGPWFSPLSPSSSSPHDGR